MTDGSDLTKRLYEQFVRNIQESEKNEKRMVLLASIAVGLTFLSIIINLLKM